MTARPRPAATARRGLRVAAARTAVVLLGGLVAGVLDREATPVAPTAGGHHAVAAPQPAPTAPPTTGASADAHVGHATTAPTTAGTTAGTPAAAGGHSVDDHGDLEVTVMLREDGETRVQGPVRPGAYISFVNHTTADQVLTSEDGAITVDVPLVRLVTVQAPTTPGTYRLVSGTDATVAAELVVA